jgi:hypothetical protein
VKHKKGNIDAGIEIAMYMINEIYLGRYGETSTLYHASPWQQAPEKASAVCNPAQKEHNPTEIRNNVMNLTIGFWFLLFFKLCFQKIVLPNW